MPELQLLYYHRRMSQPWPSTLILLLAASFAVVPGCKPRQKSQPVVVHIFRDLNSPYARELDHRILEFQATNPRLADGAVVQVQTFQAADYKSAVNNLADPAVEVVVLNSPEDTTSFPALQGEITHAVNICGAVKACPSVVPALVPSQVTGPRSEAAHKFMEYLAAQK